MICLPGTLFYIILCQNPIVKWNVPLNDFSPWYIVLYYPGPKSDRKVDTLLNAFLPWHIVLYLFGPGVDHKVGPSPNRPKIKVSDRRVAQPAWSGWFEILKFGISSPRTRIQNAQQNRQPEAGSGLQPSSQKQAVGKDLRGAAWILYRSEQQKQP